MHYTLDQLRKTVNISPNISLASRHSLFGQRFMFCCKHVSECSYIFFWGLCCSRVDPHFGPFVMSCSKMDDSLKTTISWSKRSRRAKVGRSSGVCVCVCICWVLLVTSGVALKLILVAIRLRMYRSQQYLKYWGLETQTTWKCEIASKSVHTFIKKVIMKICCHEWFQWWFEFLDPEDIALLLKICTSQFTQGPK